MNTALTILCYFAIGARVAWMVHAEVVARGNDKRTADVYYWTMLILWFPVLMFCLFDDISSKMRELGK